MSTSISPQSQAEGSKKSGKSVKTGKKEKVGPRTVAPVAEAPGPTSRINIALPFSQIRMQEPSSELTDLVALIGDLVVALKDTLRASDYEAFEGQVDSLRARLR